MTPAASVEVDPAGLDEGAENHFIFNDLGTQDIEYPFILFIRLV